MCFISVFEYMYHLFEMDLVNSKGMLMLPKVYDTNCGVISAITIRYLYTLFVLFSCQMPSMWFIMSILFLMMVLQMGTLWGLFPSLRNV